MPEFLVAFLTFLAVIAMGGAILSAMAARRRRIQARLHELTGTPAEAARGRDSFTRALRRVGTAVSSGGPSKDLNEQLTRAGYHSSNAAPVYIGAKILLLFAGIFGIFALLFLMKVPILWTVLFALMGGAILSFIPNFVVAMRRRSRTRNVRNHLPDAIDLLEVCVSSGMGLDMAWNMVANEIRSVSNLLADEMALTNLEIHLGSPRVTAMRNLAERTGVDDISSLVAVLVQSERFGTSVADALRTFATSMRQDRGMRAQEEAERMAVRLLFPMVLFIFPAVIIVLVGPAGLKLAKIISGS
ncbi:MAG: type II secretion system F family protein [Planctomycetota bacterium]|jgi:tight adherence protein C